jgi:DNA-binding response OmpR family regulator
MTVVVVAEDDADLRALLTKVVVRAGFEVVDAADGRAALAAARDPLVRAVACDVGLPLVSGVQLCRRLRAEFPDRHLPILLLSGAAGERHRDEALAAGADDYLVKPFRMETLTRRLARLIDPTATVRISPGSAADLAGRAALYQARRPIEDWTEGWTEPRRATA